MGILAYGKKCASWLQLSAHFSNVIFELIAATRGICCAPLRLKPTLNGIKLLSGTPPGILVQVIIPYSQIKSYFLGGYLEMITWSCLAYYLLPYLQTSWYSYLLWAHLDILTSGYYLLWFLTSSFLCSQKICKTKLIFQLNLRADF